MSSIFYDAHLEALRVDLWTTRRPQLQHLSTLPRQGGGPCPFRPGGKKEEEEGIMGEGWGRRILKTYKEKQRIERKSGTQRKRNGIRNAGRSLINCDGEINGVVKRGRKK